MRHWLRSVVIVLAACTAGGLAVAAPAAAAPGAGCHEYEIPVSVAPGLPADQHIAGELCLPDGPVPSVLQILVPGATYNRTYWDFPISQYSYVDAATARGYAVFAMDRLNTGASSTLPPAAVTVELDAATLHQVVTALRSGADTGTPFRNVVTVGHSLGSIITIDEAASYHDVDGLIVTGFSHYVNPLFVTNTATARVVVPTQLVQGGSPYIQNRPLGDLTTPAGGRELNFYAPGTFEPEVLAADEATKDVITASELATFPVPQSGVESNLITAPVLLAIGRYDFPFLCGTQHCTGAAMVEQFERVRFAAAPEFDAFVVPNAGHDINLARTAPLFFTEADNWITRRFGTAA
ncbi:alpha/beta hydrolase [Pseudonocardia sp.]|jgi:pimeloyl-ACP methyl ester carboxylesterase|uniref:alpha/beta hydrolase n=1 Tax=Pseudonocardia sp. TaxID=60912 RepID=UPI00261CCB3B|nr:alpha/beta hydrolase [Pseudonocardia sp.]MCW2716753.1 hypothetical protein [Pseudonocardia sp.]